MDTAKTTTHVSLCAGYGGIDLGLRRAIPGICTVAFSEIEAFACANLVSKMEQGLLDPAPVWENVKTFPYESFHRRVDILSGGYPCQPFSAAGKRRGKDDPRHLWPWIIDGIRAMQPSVCFFENVEGHISLGLEQVIADLGAAGYRATWGIFSAAEIGAVHQRKRVFILAHLPGTRLERYLGDQLSTAEPAGEGTGCERDAGNGGVPSRVLADADDLGQQQPQGAQSEVRRRAGDSDACGLWPARPGERQHAWEPPRVVAKHQPSVGRDADGRAPGLDYAELSDSRVDELRLLGNGVCPAQASVAFITLARRLANLN